MTRASLAECPALCPACSETCGFPCVFCGSNTPGEIRTPDRRIRNPLLYPAELRGRKDLRQRHFSLTPGLTPAKLKAGGECCDTRAIGKRFRGVTMTKPNSTRPEACGKPDKPYPDFPLFPHATKRWAKKVRGRLVYFGPWHDPEGALQRYLDQKDALHSGLTPRDTRAALTVFGLCGKFLSTKKQLLQSAELSIRSFNDYAATSKRLVKAFGKNRLVVDLGPDDFEKLRNRWTRTWGPVRLGGEINRVRVVFNYGIKNGLLDKLPVYGEGFKRPSKKVLRKHRYERGPKTFDAVEIRSMIDGAAQPLKTMILLGINCGFGNADIGTLPITALDVDRGWLNYPRPKTGIARRCPLWPETVGALRDWLAMRPTPKREEHADLVFITSQGDAWAKATSDNPVSKETRKLLDRLKVAGHRNFYALRHTLQTIGDEARDFLAVRHIMGHVGADIADEYREKLTDDRLRAVAEHVRGWLFAKAKPQAKGQRRKPTVRPTKKEAPSLRLFTA
jgi:integrase